MSNNPTYANIITACNERENRPHSVYDICLTVFFLFITVVTCFQIQLIMDYRRRLVKLSFYLVESGEGLCPSPENLLLVKFCY